MHAIPNKKQPSRYFLVLAILFTFLVAGSLTAFQHFLPPIPTITVTAPNGGETLCAGSTVSITWNSFAVNGNVNISLSTDGGQNYTSIGTDLPNTGTFNWLVPLETYNECLILVEGVLSAAGDESNASFTISKPVPLVVLPSYGPVGTQVVLRGAGLSCVTSVKFNGVSSSYTVSQVNTTTYALTTTVPAGASSGPIELVYAGGSEFTNVFAICNDINILSINPVSGPVGTSVVLTGRGFNANPAQNVVLFGGAKATVSAASANSLTVTVPAGATHQTITVTNLATQTTSSYAKPFVVTFLSSIDIQAFDFQSPVTFEIAPVPPPPGGANGIQYIMVEDLDFDGKPDIAVSHGGYLRIFPNTSTTGFINANTLDQMVEIPISVDKIQLVDLNGDGRKDMVGLTGFGTNNEIQINPNQITSGISTNAFASGFTIPLAGVSAVEFGDFNADGRVDIVAAHTPNYPDPGPIVLTVFPNIGNGQTLNTSSFGPGIVVFTSPSNNDLCFDIAVVDLNDDGLQDIVACGLEATVIKNQYSCANGTGLSASDFAPGFTIASKFSFSVKVADFNKDGKPDLAFSTRNTALPTGGQIEIYSNLSTPGNFNASTLLLGANLSFSNINIISGRFEVGDINGDGHVDIYTPALFEDNGVYVMSGRIFRNQGQTGPINANTFDSGLDIQMPNEAAEIAQLADIDLDGKPELIMGHFRNNFSIWKNNVTPYRTCNVTVTSVNPLEGQVGTTVVLSGSGFNDDPAQNLVLFGGANATISSASANSLTVTVPAGATHQTITVTNLGNKSTASYAKPFVVTFPSKNSISAADFEAPVKFEVAVVPPIPGGPTPIRKLMVEDLDLDGKPDVAASLGNMFRIFPNTSTSGVVNTNSLGNRVDIPTNVSEVQLVDLNGDGRKDMVGLVGSAGDYTGIQINLNQISGNITSNAFSSGFTIPLNGVTAVGFGDFNIDGLVDMVAANNPNSPNPGPMVLTVFPNIGNGQPLNVSSFGPGFVVHTSQSDNLCLDIDVLDLNGDGGRDIVACGIGATIVKNQYPCGDPLNASHFAPAFTIGTNYFKHSVEVGDFDKDGKPDLAFSEQDATNTIGIEPQIGIYRNTSAPITLDAGSFGFAVGLPLSLPGYKFSVGDLDGDSHVDIWTANLYQPVPNGILYGGRIFRNRGLGGAINTTSFESGIDMETDGAGEVGIIADADLDGKNDLIMGNVMSNLTIRRNNPISLAPVPPVVTSFSPTQAQPDDIIEIKGQNFSPGTLGNMPSPGNIPIVNAINDNIVFFGNVKGTVLNAKDTLLTVKVPVGASLDNITVLNKSNGLSGTSPQRFTPVFASISSINGDDFKPSKAYGAKQEPRKVAVGDLNNDGNPDVVVANSNSASVTIYTNVSDPELSPDSLTLLGGSEIPVGSYPWWVGIADLDGDGKNEIITSSYIFNTISVLHNIYSTNDSIDETSFEPAVQYGIDGGGTSFAVADLDMDGKPEIAATCFNGKVSVLKNTSTQGLIDANSFASKVDFTGDLVLPTAIAIADMNGDGKPEMIVASQDNKKVKVFRNTSQPGIIDINSFVGAADLQTPGNPQSVCVADLNKNGKPDIMIAQVAGIGDNEFISIYENIDSLNGYSINSDYAPRIDLPTFGDSRDIAVGDMDGDGNTDMVASSFTSSSVKIFRNKNLAGPLSISSFHESVSFSTGTNTAPMGLAIGDMDLDGKPDMVATRWQDSSFVILRNHPTFLLTTSAGAGGNINPLGVSQFRLPAEPRLVQVSSLPGYTIAQVLIDGVSATTPGGQEFNYQFDANDFADHVVEASFTIFCPPLLFIAAPGNRQGFADNNCQAVLIYQAEANNGEYYTYRLSGATEDSAGGIGSGHVFNIGITQVKIYAYNSCGEVLIHQFQVTVVDQQAPTLTCTSNIMVGVAPGQIASVPLPRPTFSDNCGVVNLSWALYTPTSTTVSSPRGIRYIDQANLLAGLNSVYYWAQDASGNMSSCNFQIEVVEAQPPAKPIISPGTNTYSGPQLVSISSSPFAIIYYTTNGSNPRFDVPNSFTKLYTGPFTILESTTIRAVATLSGFPNSAISLSAITISLSGILAKPVISPPSGTYEGNAVVTMSTTTPGAEIWYTTNGNNPRFDIPNSFTKLYTGPFTIYQSIQIKAVCTKAGLANSPMEVSNILVNNPTLVNQVQFTPPAGTYSSTQSVSLSTSTPGSTIWFTTNGSNPRFDVPNSFTRLYSAPLNIAANAVIKSVATKPGFLNSRVVTANYLIGTGSRIAFENEPNSEKLWVYPNPNQGKFNLVLQSEMEVSSLLLLNSMGQTIWRKECNALLKETEIDIQHIPVGLYVLQVLSKDKKHSIKIKRD